MRRTRRQHATGVAARDSGDAPSSLGQRPMWIATSLPGPFVPPLGLSTLTRNYGDVSTRSCCCGQAILGSELGQERGKILAGEGPLERGRRPLVVVLETEQAVLDLGQGGE